MDPFCYLCFLFVCHAVLSVDCRIVVTGWERAVLFDISLCFVTFPYSVLGQVWYWIVSISDLWLLPYFIRLASFVSGKGRANLYV